MIPQNEFILDIAFHPGETLAEKLEEINMGPKEFAIRTGKPEKTINAVLKGESAITSDMAILFEDVLQIPARFWLKQQYEYDEYIARQKRQSVIELAKDWAAAFPYAEMAKLGWIIPTRKVEEKVVHLFKYFGVSSSDAWEEYFYKQQLKVAFRISLHNTKNPHALSAWVRQGELQASKINAPSFDKKMLLAQLPKIKALMATHPHDFFQQLQELCLLAGVKVIYTPCIKQAPISGATRWINEHPVVQMTGRYNQNDRFWFTFFHELGHILLHGKKEIFLEDIEYSDYDKQKEKEADEFAIKWTFSEEEEKEVSKNEVLTETDIVEYAKKFNTHPAIIIGRLQKKEIIPYSQGRQFFLKLNFNNSNE
ncbi:HigA family addiction module antitoxin [Weeksella virosa]|uniref:HigA family addiction module antitoxin n=1 Tax=Weeksella virosa TaxID=1014 RepID=UPI0025562EAE|nr:HigA family addiction module antitoxin [Weeksella virosa]MDK7675039.1 HigA family addiction module antitoxin [Weeksella virosa]